MYDHNQEPATKGNRTKIRGRDGPEILVRSYRPDGTTTVTRAGQDFYKDKHSEYIVHVPVFIEGKRRNWTVYRRVTNAGNNERET